MTNNSDIRDADFYYTKGQALQDSQQYYEAIQNFTEAIEIYPSYCRAYLSRGSIYHSIGMYRPCIRDYDKSIEIINMLRNRVIDEENQLTV